MGFDVIVVLGAKDASIPHCGLEDGDERLHGAELFSATVGEIGTCSNARPEYIAFQRSGKSLQGQGALTQAHQIIRRSETDADGCIV